jgi:excisionase family DNA binding protein
MGDAAELLVTMTKRQLAELLKDTLSGSVKAANEPEVMTMQQVAHMLDVHTKTLMNKVVKERGLPVHYIGPKDPRFRRSEVLAWLSEQGKEVANGGG